MPQIDWSARIEELCRNPRYNRENPDDPRNVLTEQNMREALAILRTTTLSDEIICGILLHGGEEISNAATSPDFGALEVPNNPGGSLIEHAKKLAVRYSPAACEERERMVSEAIESLGKNEANHLKSLTQKRSSGSKPSI